MIKTKKYVAVPYKNLTSYDGALMPRYQTADFAEDVGYIKIETPSYHQVDPDTPEWDSFFDRLSKIENGSIFLHQLPAYASEELEVATINFLHAKHCKVVAYIHDIDYLRGFDKTFRLKDLFNSLDVALVASQPVVNFLKDQGVSTKLIITGMWDYYADGINGNKLTNPGKVINYAGNLFKKKAGFLIPLSVISDYPINVWGYIDNNTINPLRINVKYWGKTNSNNLNIDSGWGLVWDDNEELSHSGYNDYQKYNWSYKLALYLRNGLPIIARSNTNMGDYIEDHGLGITISNLYMINEKISKAINSNNFKQIKVNCYQYSKMLNRGYFLKNAIKKAENYLEGEQN